MCNLIVKNLLKKISCFLLSAFVLIPCISNLVFADHDDDSDCVRPTPECHVRIMERNDCFRVGRQTPKSWLMIHSTAEPGVRAEEWYDLWNRSCELGDKDAKEVAVHFFLDDGSIWQYLPISTRSWHCGGRANNFCVSIEICEPKSISYDSEHRNIVEYNPKDPENQRYFEACWRNAVSLCACLCRKYGISPVQIISHNEGHVNGVASGHVDPEHWWKFHGKNMDMFRKDVLKEFSEKSCLIPEGIFV